MRIHALTVDRGGCFYYRIRQPLTSLRGFGHITSWGSTMDKETYDAADIIVTQYIHEEGTIRNWEKWCAQGDKLCVWDADDDIFDVTQVTGSGSAYNNPETIPRMIRGIQAAHLVTVATPGLAKVYGRYNKNVVVLRNCIPNWTLTHEMPERSKAFTVGYTASPSHQEDIQDFATTLVRIMNKIPATTLHFYGPSERPIGMPDWWKCNTFGWKKLTAEYLASLSMDVGIAPLRKMSFNNGKSGIKAQEYQALGIVPVVADFPQYKDVIIHGETGFLCSSPAQWIHTIKTLAKNPKLRQDVAAAGREHAKTFAMNQNAHLWDEAYTIALKGSM